MKWTRLLAATALLAACDRQITDSPQAVPGSDLMEVGPLTTDILRPGPVPAQSSMVVTAAPPSAGAAAIAPIPTSGPHTDILWRRTVSGENLVWRMNGVTYNGSSVSLPTAASNWEVGGIADFNRDARPDILWRRPSTSSNVIWMMNGLSSVGDIVALPTAAPEWKMAGAGDFDRDGSPDILWRRPSTSSVVLWMMNGTTLRDIVALPALDSTWTVGGIADMTGDGKLDIVIRRQSTGANAVWQMNGVQRTGEIALRPVTGAWVLGGVADFTRDGNADLVWRHPTSRDVVIWAMKRTSYTEGDQANLPSVHPEWSIAGVADFDPPPPPPAGLTATPDVGSRINLAWQDRGTLETSYRVESRAGTATTWTLLATLPENTTTYAHTGVVVGVPYTYRIVACNPTGCGDPSPTATAVTSASAPTATTSTPVYELNAEVVTPGGNVVANGLSTTAWVELDDNAGMTSPASSDTVFAGSTSTPVFVARPFFGLTVGATYHYRIVARNAAGTTYGAVQTFTVSPPPAPIDLAATFTPNTVVSLTWKLPANWYTKYAKVESRTTPDGAWTPVFCNVTSSERCIDPDVNTNTPTTVWYRVQLCNDLGCGPFAETSVTTQVFARPTDLVATAGPGRVTLSWTDNSPNETYFAAERRSEFETAWKFVGLSAGRADTSVTAGVRYYYRVRAAINTGYGTRYSAASNEADAVPY
ncbi:FG-GAP-like repeat-containing protein [Longimicrobium terrae]|uniref:Fibronectin type-III domain-containing protein n=1 Tax=Longimicrobium terrae TaxID=1639882 RepID=A0A841H6H5_9BACT|nr:FG-GAP-like repeat-containing protein [Longimicrobium terrae]MBB4639272.1 hypothetical protein [Longimicrobium terrae]MBB6073512.1 hypothetical protein [Longimicrobium terrae]NNC32238.1 hypothetical protein [Longimicrobium terrae]